jgi:hypothetical protein
VSIGGRTLDSIRRLVVVACNSLRIEKEGERDVSVQLYKEGGNQEPTTVTVAPYSVYIELYWLLLLYIKRESVFHCTHTAPPPSSFSFLFFRHTRSLDGSCTRRKWNICVCFFFVFVRGGSSYIYTCYPHTQTTNKQNEKREKLDSMVHCAPSG